MYLMVSIFVLGFSYYLFKKASGSLSFTQLNLISWIFYYGLILQTFIASLLIVYNLDDHYLIHKLSDQNNRFYGWLATQYTMIALPAGMLLINYLFGYRNINKIWKEYISSKTTTLFSLTDSYIRYPLYILSIASVLSLIYTFLNLRTIPIFSLLSGAGAEVLMELRIDSTREFGGIELVRNIFGLTLSPILAFISYGYYKITHSLKDKIWFYVMLFNSIFMLTYNLEKAPLIVLMIGFLFINVVINNGIKKKTLIIFFTVAVSLIVILYMYVGKVDAGVNLFFSYNNGILGRILLSQAAGTYLSLDIFPRSVDFLGFSSVSPWISSLLDIDYKERSIRILMEQVNPEGIKLGIAGVINSLFIAEAWANFGLLGISISPIYIGALIQLFNLLILKSKKTPISIAIYAYFATKFSVTSGVNDFIYNGGYIAVFLIFINIYFFAYILKKGRKIE